MFDVSATVLDSGNTGMGCCNTCDGLAGDCDWTSHVLLRTPHCSIQNYVLNLRTLEKLCNKHINYKNTTPRLFVKVTEMIENITQPGAVG